MEQFLGSWFDPKFRVRGVVWGGGVEGGGLQSHSDCTVFSPHIYKTYGPQLALDPP